jgi:SAM-dependent methyltransferase
MFPGWAGYPREFLAAHEKDLAPDARPPTAARNREPWRGFSFSWQWNMYEYSDVTWEMDLRKRVDLFYYYLDAAPGALKDKLILDAGCGNGTLSAGIAASGPIVIGLDFSLGVENAQAHRKRFAGDRWPHVHYVQGDVRQPPFAPATFDVVYSDGVLHHTDNTQKAFAAVAPLARSGGKVWIWLYGARLEGFVRWKVAMAKAIRVSFRHLPFALAKALCYVGAAGILALTAVARAVGLTKRRLVPVRQKAVNLFDTLTPRYGFSHTVEEATAWFQEAGLTSVRQRDVVETRTHGFGILGVR